MRIVTILIAICGFATAQAQDSTSFKPWSYKTAHCLPAKSWEYSITGPLRYGISNRVELQTNPLANIVMPNLAARVHIGHATAYTLATEHKLTYYTSFLKFLQGKGTGALIPPTADIPAIWMLSNSVAITKPIGKTIATSQLTLNLSLRSKPMSKLYTVDIAMIYPRFAPIFNGPTFKWSNNVQGKLYHKFNYLVSADIYKVMAKDHNFFFEAGAHALWAPSARVNISAGTKLVYGNYPFGHQWNLIPAVNCIISGKRK